jgi:hypothetical protein
MVMPKFISRSTAMRRICWTLLQFAARRRQAWLAALVLRILTEPFGIVQCSPAQGRSHTILVLNSGKDEYARDLEEIFRNDHSYRLVKWPAYALEGLATAILHPSLKHDRYVSDDPTIEATKIEYRAFLSKVWPYYDWLIKTDAVMSANFGYCFQREMSDALEQLGTPFLVIQKENLNAVTQQRREIFYNLYKNGRGRFCGRKIIVYNEMERDLEVASGIAEPSRIVVAGMPRLDRFHRWRMERAGKLASSDCPTVLFFSFSRSDKIPHPRVSKITKDWGEFCTKVHLTIAELARSRPDIHFIAKTKGLGRQDDELLKALSMVFDKPPANLEIVSGGDAFPLMTRSRAIVGFNTSGLLEGIALGIPVVTPRFDEALDPILAQFVLDLAGAASYANSPSDLRNLICQHASTPLIVPTKLTADVTEVLDRYVGNSDGLAGSRALNVIDHEIKRGFVSKRHDRIQS